MNKEKTMIWGREFELEVRYDCYTGEEILDSQKDAVASFLKSEGDDALSLEQVKRYCLSQNGEEIKDGIIENIFKYVAPKYLYVPQSTDRHIVAIMCNYKFDQENGIAVVFENEKFCKVGSQDIIL